MCEAIWLISCDLLTMGSKGKILAWLFAVLSSKPREFDGGLGNLASGLCLLLFCLWG